MSKNNNDDTIVNVQEVYGKAESFFEKNRKSIYIGGGVIVAAIAGFLVYQFAIKGPKETEAQNAIFKAIQYQEIDSASMALNGGPDFAGFEEIATKYSGTKAGMVASYWCGVNYRDMGEFEKAIQHFKNADFEVAATSKTNWTLWEFQYNRTARRHVITCTSKTYQCSICAH